MWRRRDHSQILEEEGRQRTPQRRQRNLPPPHLPTHCPTHLYHTLHTIAPLTCLLPTPFPMPDHIPHPYHFCQVPHPCHTPAYWFWRCCARSHLTFLRARAASTLCLPSTTFCVPRGAPAHRACLLSRCGSDAAACATRRAVWCAQASTWRNITARSTTRVALPLGMSFSYTAHCALRRARHNKCEPVR